MKVGAIIQARTGSTRLPGKVLKELPYGSGITVLQQVVRRLKRAQTLDEIIVAKTTKAEDLPIVAG
jgi:spore coat polysaccharide biosynthesis protein SpsF